MAFTFTILRAPVPADDQAAWDHCHQILQSENGTQAPDFLALIEQLKRQFPCICDLPDDLVDDGVWSDGPLSNNAGNNATTLAIVWSKVDLAFPEIVRIACTSGFVVFDYQSEGIYRPR